MLEIYLSAHAHQLLQLIFLHQDKMHIPLYLRRMAKYEFP